MTWAEFVLDIRIVLGLLIGVFDQKADGGTGGAPFEDAGQDLHPIVFTTLRGVTGLTRFASIKIVLQIAFAKFQPRRTTIDDTDVSRTMALARRAQRKQFTNRVAGHGGILTGNTARQTG